MTATWLGVTATWFGVTATALGLSACAYRTQQMHGRGARVRIGRYDAAMHDGVSSLLLLGVSTLLVSR